MVKLPRWTAHGAFVGCIAFAVLFAIAYPGGMAGGSPLAAISPSLGSAQSFAVLGGSTVTNTGPTTITGDLGVSPGGAVTGFPPGIVSGGTIHAADALALQAQNSVVTAYNNLAGQTCDVDLTGQDLGGKTLTPGVYCFSSSAGLTGALTLDAQGNASAVWVFRVGSTLTTASNSSVSVINGGTNCNVFWQVGSSATLGTNSTFVGSILALTSITLNTGARISGRALARNGAVTMDTNDVSASGCTPAPTPTGTPTAPGTPTPPGSPTPSGTPTPTVTPQAVPYGEVQVGKFTGSDCTTNLQPEDGVRFGIGSQGFLTGRVGPGVDRQIIAAGINQVEMQGRAGWRTCARVIDPFTGEVLRREIGDGETVLVDVTVHPSKTTEVYVTNIKVALALAVVPTPTATPLPFTPTSTPASAQQSPAPAVETPGPAAPLVTAELAQTQNVALPMNLPRAGGQSDGVLILWLALAGAASALLGFSMRRRTR